MIILMRSSEELTIMLFESAMHKYKAIAKSYQHRDERVNREREGKREGGKDVDCDEESGSSFIAEIDLNCYYANQQEDYSIEDFINSLQTKRDSYGHEEQPIDVENFHLSSPSSTNSSLERINAQYMAAMSCQGSRLDIPQAVRFEPSIRVKFFNDANPVAELMNAQQYTTIYQPYQQTSDEDVAQFSP